jgi:Tfp pilus assembly protein PilN
LKIELTAQSLGVTAVLRDPTEVDMLIRMLEANKALLAATEKVN